MSSSPPPRVAWGAGILAALAGCAPSAAPSAAPSPGGAPRLDDAPLRAHEARLTGPDAERFGLWSFRAQSGRGQLFYTRFWPLNPGQAVCPFPSPSPDACGLLTVRPAGGEERAMIPAPRDWGLLVPGREGFYAVRNRGKAGLDWVDPQGNTSMLSEAPESSTWSRLWVVELARRQFLISGDYASLSLHELTRPPGGPPALSRPVELPLSPALSAQDARRAQASGKRALYGPPVLLPLATDDRWAMAWVEAIAPPYDHPRGKPWRSGAKNGCGGPSSRSLADVSVEKRIVVSRFRGTEALGDEVILTSNEISLVAQHLEARAEGDRVIASLSPGAPRE